MNGKNLHESGDFVLVRSANGHTQRQSLTRPIWIRNPKTGEDVKSQVIVSPSCPFNLLGRDVMTKLGLAIYPTKQGGMVARRCVSADILLMKGQGIPFYYWTLHVPDTSPGNTASALLQEAQKVVSPESDFQPRNDIHVTLRYSNDGRPGPDPPYDELIHKLGPQKVVVTSLCWKENTCLCTVLLGPQAEKLVCLGTPHISLSKASDEQWQDNKRHMWELNRARDWKDMGYSQHSPGTGWWKKMLNFVVITTPETRMADPNETK